MIEVGTSRFGSAHVGNSIAFTAFALAMIVAAVECRSEMDSALTTDTFDSEHLNRSMIVEFILAILVTQMGVFNRLLGTRSLTCASGHGRWCRRSACSSCGRSAS